MWKVTLLAIEEVMVGKKYDKTVLHRTLTSIKVFFSEALSKEELEIPHYKVHTRSQNSFQFTPFITSSHTFLWIQLPSSDPQHKTQVLLNTLENRLLPTHALIAKCCSELTRQQELAKTSNTTCGELFISVGYRTDTMVELNVIKAEVNTTHKDGISLH